MQRNVRPFDPAKHLQEVRARGQALASNRRCGARWKALATLAGGDRAGTRVVALHWIHDARIWPGKAAERPLTAPHASGPGRAVRAWIR